MKGSFAAALGAIKTHRLRSILTISIIAVGITALVGIETAIGVLSGKVSESFGRFGAGSVTLVPGSGETDGRAREAARAFTWEEATAFSESFRGPLGERATLSITLSSTAVARASGRQSDPTLTLLAADGGWLENTGCTLSEGRNFTAHESASGSGVCLIGAGVARRLFPDAQTACGEYLTVAGRRFQVIGLIAERGSLFGGGPDRSLVIPLAAARPLLPAEGADYRIALPGYPQDPARAGALEREARARMRQIRRLPPGAPDDFSFRRSDELTLRLASLSDKLSLAALAIGLITLLGAAAGLMNILLVSVKERTAEIGLRKALGEPVRSIRRTFLAEALLFGQIGGAAGIALGLMAGLGVALVLEAPFQLPWEWMGVAFVLCLLVSLMAGTLPARRAAALQPVDALRAC